VKASTWCGRSTPEMPAIDGFHLGDPQWSGMGLQEPRLARRPQKSLVDRPACRQMDRKVPSFR